jgi:hypothetical protein
MKMEKRDENSRVLRGIYGVRVEKKRKREGKDRGKRRRKKRRRKEKVSQ